MTHPSSAADDLDLIETIIARSSAGIGISSLEEALAQSSTLISKRRTLQRRLKHLIVDGRVVAEGKSIALVYKLTPSRASTFFSGDVVADGSGVPVFELYVPLSPEGSVLRDKICLPPMFRRPVGYRRTFLDAYEPGVTYYLPESLRIQLHEMGRAFAGERPAGTHAREILNRLLVDLSWASSRLEGNTYSRLDTQKLIEFGQVAQGKDALETQMILNHKAAIEMLIEDADQVGFDIFTFQNLHAVLSQDLLLNQNACGHLRRCAVEISGTVFLPLAMPQMIEDCFRLLLQKAGAIPDPFEQAFFLMVQLPYLQPFEDVNKRVSRIGANIPLIKHNLCPLSFIDVPEKAYVEGTLAVYELNQIELLRDVFIWAYERSCQRYLAISQTMVEPDPLKIRYREMLIEAVQSVVKGVQIPNQALIARIASEYAPAADQGVFARMLQDALRQLHEGSVARYRLRRSEYVAWQAVQVTPEA